MIADLSINFVERQALLCGFSVERIEKDYGYDLLLFTYDPAGEIEPGCVYLQLKATDKIRILPKRQAVAFSLKGADLELWFAETMPVVLIVYDGQGTRLIGCTYRPTWEA